MCGVLGVYSPSFSTPEFDIFEKLLFLNVFRGTDSTGIVRIEKNKSIKTRKSLLPSPSFIASEASDIMRDKGTANERPMGLIGHTRSATKGSVTLKNAHPFAFENVTGVHNGTIHTQFKHRAEYDTDSEALYRNINDYGLEEALNNINAYDSAYVLAFVDRKERTMNFVRNSKRTLWFTYIFGTSSLLWSSEKIALEYVLKHKGMGSNKGWNGDDKEKYFTLNPNELLSFPLGDSPSEAKVTKLKVEEKKTSGTTTSGISVYRGPAQGSQGTFEAGEWKKIGSGYEWVPKAKPTLITLPASENQTSTSTGTTSDMRPVIFPTTTVKVKTTKGKGPSRTKDPLYENFKETQGMEDLKKLSWLKPPVNDDLPQNVLDDMKIGLPELDWQDPGNQEPVVEDSSVIPFDGPYSHDDNRTFKGFQGMRIKQAEFAQRLKGGCFACSESLDLNNVHDFEKINAIHWWTREYFACDYCFKHSDGDWVRCTIEDDWSEPGHNNKVG